MNLSQQNISLLSNHGLTDLSDRIEVASKPSCLLQLSEPTATPDPGRSRIGGHPDLPSAELWPSSGRTALTFIGQINLAELPSEGMAGLLPDTGLLLFFYDVDETPWGFDTSERRGWKVIYVESGRPTYRVASPPDPAIVPCVFPSLDISFIPDLTVPPLRSIELGKLGLNDDQLTSYVEFRLELESLESLHRPLHRLLGHPDSIQGCMQRTVQFASRDLKLPEGVYSYYEHPQAAELIPGAHDWQLLLQIDSDDRFPVMWGDAGRIYFWIHRDDLAAKDFSKCWVFLQCH